MEGIVVIGLISLAAFFILRIVSVLDDMHCNKQSVINNLYELHQYDYATPVLKAKYEYLYELNQKISKQLGIKPPPIYLQDTDTNNAMAINTGFFQAVIFETKTFIGLDAQGLGAVLAHELYHIQQKHYLKSVARHFFIGASWIVLNMFILMNVVDSINLAEPATKGESYYWVICLMFFFSGATLMGDHVILAIDRFIGRRQEIECDIFAAEATSFSDYLIEAHYFKDYEDFWSKPLTGFRAIKYHFFTTHPDWNKRIQAVANVNTNRK